MTLVSDARHRAPPATPLAIRDATGSRPARASRRLPSVPDFVRAHRQPGALYRTARATPPFQPPRIHHPPATPPASQARGTCTATTAATCSRGEFGYRVAGSARPIIQAGVSPCRAASAHGCRTSPPLARTVRPRCRTSPPSPATGSPRSRSRARRAARKPPQRTVDARERARPALVQHPQRHQHRI